MRNYQYATRNAVEHVPPCSKFSPTLTVWPPLWMADQGVEFTPSLPPTPEPTLTPEPATPIPQRHGFPIHRIDRWHRLVQQGLAEGIEQTEAERLATQIILNEIECDLRQ